MKKIGILLTFILVAVLSYFVGEKMGENNNISSTEMLKKQADGILAYQHYYEAAQDIIESQVYMVNVPYEQVKNLENAKQHLEDYRNNVVMQWPEVCDQRDMLSDAIRKFADHHLNAKGDDDIMSFVEDCGVNPEILSNWVYAY